MSDLWVSFQDNVHLVFGHLICDFDYFWEQRLLDLTLHGSKLSSLFQIADLCRLKCSGRLWCIQHLFGSIGLLVIDYNLQLFFLRNPLQPHIHPVTHVHFWSWHDFTINVIWEKKWTNVLFFFFSANGCYSGSEPDLCHTGIEKDVKYKHFVHATTVNSTKTLSNGHGDVDGVYHRTLSDVEVSRLCLRGHFMITQKIQYSKQM